MQLLPILSRWLHVLTACVALGGVFFMRIILPVGLRLLEPDQRLAVLLKIRRVFKMVIHTSILLLLVTGVYNSYLAFPKYSLDPALNHPIWGTHILLALGVFAISLYLLAGPTLKKNHLQWLTVNLILLALTVAAASTLKFAREKTVADHAAAIARP
jgi:uncharacterized membrane protein